MRRVLWFEREGDGFRAPAGWPALAAACVSTHDLATLAGWWEGAEITERAALGLLSPSDATAALVARARERASLAAACAVPSTGFGPATAGAVHRFVAATPSRVMLVQAEDLVGERVGVNLPGTDHERVNWRRRLPVVADALFEGEIASAILDSMAERLA
jgi:glycogen operon protein